MRHLYVVLFATTLLAACGDTADTPADTPAETTDEGAEWLFVVDAEGATLSDTTLTLTGVNPEVIAFTDRPERQSATLSMEDLAAAWAEGADSFADDPPNAILGGTYTDDEGNETHCSIEVELMAAPTAANEADWDWEVLELARWEGCPEANVGFVELSRASVFIDCACGVVMDV